MVVTKYYNFDFGASCKKKQFEWEFLWQTVLVDMPVSLGSSTIVLIYLRSCYDNKSSGIITAVHVPPENFRQLL
jgi:hypothetical protein